MTNAIKYHVRQLKAVVTKEAKGRALACILGLDFRPQDNQTEIEDAAMNLADDLLCEEYEKWVKHYAQLNREGKL